MPSTTVMLDMSGEESMLVMRPFSKMTVRFSWRECPSNTRALVIAVLAMAMNVGNRELRALRGRRRFGNSRERNGRTDGME